MSDLSEERAVMLIVHGGNARSHALRAIDLASKGDFIEADRLMAEATKSLKDADAIQKKYIEKNLEQGSDNETSMRLMEVHAQDHYMNALTVIDLAERFIELYTSRKESLA